MVTFTVCYVVAWLLEIQILVSNLKQEACPISKLSKLTIATIFPHVVVYSYRLSIRIKKLLNSILIVVFTHQQPVVCFFYFTIGGDWRGYESTISAVQSTKSDPKFLILDINLPAPSM